MSDTTTAAQALVDAEDAFLAAWLTDAGIELPESALCAVRIGWSARGAFERRREQTILVESGGEWE